MEFVFNLVLILKVIVSVAPSNIHEYNIQGLNDCNPRDFSQKSQLYRFTADHAYKCEFPITAPFFNIDKHYCVNVHTVSIDQSCPVEMRIYEGLNAYFKVPKMTLTCDSKIKKSFCVWGPNAGVFIKFRAHRKTKSEISLRIVQENRPRTTTSFTPYQESSMNSLDMSSIFIILTIAAAVIFVFIILCYCCCCRKSNSGTVVRQPMNYQQPPRSSPTSQQQQSIIPAREPHLIPYVHGPPDYNTSLPLITPTAPPLEPHHVDNDPPPSYESVINSSGT